MTNILGGKVKKRIFLNDVDNDFINKSNTLKLYSVSDVKVVVRAYQDEDKKNTKNFNLKKFERFFKKYVKEENIKYNETKFKNEVKKDLQLKYINRTLLKDTILKDEKIYILKNVYKWYFEKEENKDDKIDLKKMLHIVKDYKKHIEEEEKKKLEERKKNIIHFKESIKDMRKGDIIEIIFKDDSNIYFSLNDENFKLIDDIINSGSLKIINTLTVGHDSNAQMIRQIIEKDIKNIKLHTRKIKINDNEVEDVFDLSNLNIKKSGSFFKYYCIMNIDLSRYGILQNFNKEYYDDNCFYHAMKNAGLDNVKLEEIKLFCKDSYLYKSNLKKICEKLDICIKLHHYEKNETNQYITNYGDTDKIVYNIALIDEHYIVYEKTNITSFAIENYNDISDIKDFNKIYKKHNGVYKKSNERFIDSLKLCKLLLEQKDKLLIQIKPDELYNTPYFNKVKNVDDYDLKYNENDIREFTYIKKEENLNCVYYFFDFETTTNINDDTHKPYMVCYSKYDDNIKDVNVIIKYDNLGFKFLNEIVDNEKSNPDYNIVLYAHNVRYDLSFISKYLFNISTIKAGGQIISMTGFFKNRKFILKDTYSIISMPLRDFPNSFSILNTEKEVIDYDIYNDYVNDYFNDNKKLYDVDELTIKYFNKKTLSENDRKEMKIKFVENCKKWKIIDKDNKIDIMDYALHYCYQDVYILKQGFKIFRNWIKNEIDIDIINFYTISSIADYYFKKNGCYDGVYILTGKPRIFINECVVGGRVMMSKNEKNIIGDFEKLIENKNEIIKDEDILKFLNENVSDFDGISLYPSSMSVIEGTIKGKPKVIHNKNYSDLKQKDYYFVEILIKKIGIHRNFPLMSKKNNDGVRIFTNDMINEKIKVDKIALEDLIEYHDIEFDIIRGYYFDRGFNKKITESIKLLFNKRKEYKQKNNKIEMIYKLIMNSAYGKTILKEDRTIDKYFNNKEEGIKYMLRNYNKVISGCSLHDDKKFLVKEKNCEIDEHENFCHIGCYILSMSKRIMNSVMCLAEDNNIKIYYQDTDSIHLEKSDIDKLEKKYSDKYNKKLIGENLCQFHNDFSIKKDGYIYDDVVACGCVFLGKKCYLDILKTVDNKYLDLHIRLKGISDKSIKYTANKLYNNKNKKLNIIELYYDLFNGEEVNFDLTCDNNEIKFKKFDLTIKSINEFSRKIKF